jgi:8-oxo-dGTP diphosphatase
MPYTPILATLGYVLSPDGGRVLLIHRNRRPDDPHFGKYNGLGGKLEPDEDLSAGLCREIAEEAGLDCRAPRLAGTVSFPGFGRHGEHWFVAIFVVTDWTGTPAERNHEGTLVWVDLADLLAGAVPMWEGDRWFLSLVFAQPARAFHGVMPYAGGRPVSWRYTLA